MIALVLVDTAFNSHFKFKLQTEAYIKRFKKKVNKIP